MCLTRVLVTEEKYLFLAFRIEITNKLLKRDSRKFHTISIQTYDDERLPISPLINALGHSFMIATVAEKSIDVNVLSSGGDLRITIHPPSFFV